ncbi:MAG TPA: response regulator [Ideonella sp.]|uniref:response regulator n=1 Tax=Ideonella sp. TaxID=1929293 RepID=UPI002E30C1C9|nr:response regulator [Ideonella sp.]HEX5688174.1 response regulator [Ideonella sp.]
MSNSSNLTTTTRARRVMVVDDDQSNLILASEVVRMFGHEPIVWGSSAAALEAIQSDHVDLIFMDVHMPGMSGLELTQQIRALEHRQGRRRTPIVALTASAMPEERAECLANGMDDVMTKPFQFAAIKAMIDRWCEPFHLAPDSK